MRYFYPQDIVVTVENGVRTAQLDLTLPTKWTDKALELLKTDWITGWEFARREYEREYNEKWLKRVHPRIYIELKETRKAYASGMSVSQFAEYWNAYKCDIIEREMIKLQGDDYESIQTT